MMINVGILDWLLNWLAKKLNKHLCLQRQDPYTCTINKYTGVYFIMLNTMGGGDGRWGKMMKYEGGKGEGKWEKIV